RTRPPRHLHPFPTRRSSDLRSSSRTLAPDIAAAPLSEVSARLALKGAERNDVRLRRLHVATQLSIMQGEGAVGARDTRRVVGAQDRKSTRLNSSHVKISYAV